MKEEPCYNIEYFEDVKQEINDISKFRHPDVKIKEERNDHEEIHIDYTNKRCVNYKHLDDPLDFEELREINDNKKSLCSENLTSINDNENRNFQLDYMNPSFHSTPQIIQLPIQSPPVIFPVNTQPVYHTDPLKICSEQRSKNFIKSYLSNLRKIAPKTLKPRTNTITTGYESVTLNISNSNNVGDDTAIECILVPLMKITNSDQNMSSLVSTKLVSSQPDNVQNLLSSNLYATNVDYQSSSSVLTVDASQSSQTNTGINSFKQEQYQHQNWPMHVTVPCGTLASQNPTVFFVQPPPPSTLSLSPNVTSLNAAYSFVPPTESTLLMSPLVSDNAYPLNTSLCSVNLLDNSNDPIASSINLNTMNYQSKNQNIYYIAPDMPLYSSNNNNAINTLTTNIPSLNLPISPMMLNVNSRVAEGTPLTINNNSSLTPISIDKKLRADTVRLSSTNNCDRSIIATQMTSKSNDVIYIPTGGQSADKFTVDNSDKSIAMEETVAVADNDYQGRTSYHLRSSYRHCNNKSNSININNGTATGWNCSRCDKHFSTKWLLKRHMQHSHEKAILFGCDHCGKSFAYKSSLIFHVKLHLNDKPHRCYYCDKSFISRVNLETHLTIHTDYRPFGCDYCKKKFRSKSYLIVHTRKHTNENPFKCSHCNRRFITRSQMLTHSRSHTNEKRYVCSHCDKRFVTKATVAEHIKVIHMRLKRYRCYVCFKRFGNHSNMIVHLKKCSPL